MALQKQLELKRYGTVIAFAAAYISVYTIEVYQAEVTLLDDNKTPVIDPDTMTAVKRVVWQARAVFNVHTNKAAKDAREEPFDKLTLVGELDPNKQNTVHGFVYGMAKMHPLLAGAEDV